MKFKNKMLKRLVESISFLFVISKDVLSVVAFLDILSVIAHS